jgi:hypothetical protein
LVDNLEFGGVPFADRNYRPVSDGKNRLSNNVRSVQGLREVNLEEHDPVARLITEVTRLLGMVNARLRSKGYI